MKPVYVSIQSKATGKRMRQLLDKNGYSVRDIQEAFGFEYPQAVYHWLSGRSLPNLDNIVILSKILHTTIEEILVLDEDCNLNTGSGSYIPGAVLFSLNILSGIMQLVPVSVQLVKEDHYTSSLM